ncbi:unnamed protein product, partial [Urochloa humidicola]
STTTKFTVSALPPYALASRALAFHRGFTLPSPRAPTACGTHLKCHLSPLPPAAARLTVEGRGRCSSAPRRSKATAGPGCHADRGRPCIPAAAGHGSAAAGVGDGRSRPAMGLDDGMARGGCSGAGTAARPG